MTVSKSTSFLFKHAEYVIMAVPSLIVAYGNYQLLEGNKQHDQISNTEYFVLLGVPLLLSLVISTARHYSESLEISIQRYASIGIVFPLVMALIVPVNAVLTGTNVDVFWILVGCIFGGVICSVMSIVIGLTMRVMAILVKRLR
jgi:hypothetical protein